MAITLTITNAGRAALVNAAHTGTAPVTIAQIGLSGTAVVPNAAMAALPGEYKRLATLSGDVVAADTIHLIVRDESADVFTVRSLAMYLGDGTLFAVYGQAPVLVEKSAQALLLLAVDVKFEDIAASSITFGDTNFLNPPATTEVKGVVELATVAEAQAGIDALRALTPSSARAAVLGWLLAQDGAGSGLDADLLDGQDGSYYANVAARLGFTPVQQGTGIGQSAINTVKIGWSGTRLKASVDLSDQGNLVTDSWLAFGALSMNGSWMSRSGLALWGPDNDGAGSGLDADLLDGQDSSYYVNIPARLGYTPANRAGDTFTGPIRRDFSFYLDFSGSNPIINFDAYDYFAFDRAGNNLILFIGGNPRATFGGDGWLTVPTGLSVGGNVVWHSGNDGAGSGLDADLLDGQDSSYYANIPARLGYTPLNVAGGTMQGALAVPTVESQGIAARPSTSTALEVRGNGTGASVITFHRPGSHATFLGLDTDNKLKLGGWSLGANAYEIWHSGNDGSGSGLDADLLDGQEGSYYANVAARLGFTPVQQGTGIGQSAINTIKIGWSGSRLKATVDASDLGNLVTDGWLASGTLGIHGASLYRGGLPVWGPDNDGAGSGLDADTLDGFHASDLFRIIAESKTGSGYMHLSNGLLLQWGRWTSSPSPGAAVNVTFPVAFSEEPFTLVTMPVVTSASSTATWSSDGISGAYFPARCSVANIGCRYFAIGPV